MMTSKIIIGALSNNRVIGQGDGMPWHVPEEYEKFLNFTTGQTLIVGRRTYHIFGSSFTSAHTIVVTRSGTDLKGVDTVPDLPAAVKLAETWPLDIYFSGGQRIYAEALDIADKMYLSYIKGDFEGDTFFPEFSADDWQLDFIEPHSNFDFHSYSRH